MKLTHENYFSKEASTEYMSASQYKDFAGSLGRKGCEAQAMAKIRGEWQQEMTTPLLVGSYVDAHFEGSLPMFKAKYPEIFTKGGELKSTFKQADDIITRCERDPLFMRYMGGQKQLIFIGEMFGTKWKCKVDSYDPDKSIVDLKVMKSIGETKWVRDYGSISFVEFWGYDIQGAIYQEIVRQNVGKTLPFFIAAASKEKYTDIEIIGFLQSNLSDMLSLVQSNIDRVLQVKRGEVEADRCEICDYCKFSKVLTAPVHYSRLVR